jgi:hypothetical protein
MRFVVNFASKYPPADPGAFPSLAPQRGLTATDKKDQFRRSVPKTAASQAQPNLPLDSRNCQTLAAGKAGGDSWEARPAVANRGVARASSPSPVCRDRRRPSVHWHSIRLRNHGVDDGGFMFCWVTWRSAGNL